MQYENLNIDVLKTTLGLLFGDKAFELAQRTYTAIAAGMENARSQGWQDGHKAGYEQAMSDSDVIDMRDDGTLAAIEHQMDTEAEAIADAYVFAADTYSLNGEYDASNVQDSGDA